ncbi:hypothetical protein [Arsenophonus sp. PmNCSU2021_1]|uniref:hypothetical protein n=1 Tax=Arsenophonus sp. PmNCSU2021_1 TaxID=3118989 RepID=UPI002FF268D4
MLKAIPAPTFTGYNDSKIIASSGEIIGAQQDADLVVSALLYDTSFAPIKKRAIFKFNSA